MIAYIKYYFLLKDKRITDSQLILFSKRYIARNKTKLTDNLWHTISPVTIACNGHNKKQNRNISEVQIYVENKYILYKNDILCKSKHIVIENLDPKIYSKTNIKISIIPSNCYTGNIVIKFDLCHGTQISLFPYIVFIPIQKIINNHEDISCSLGKYLKL